MDLAAIRTDEVLKRHLQATRDLAESTQREIHNVANIAKDTKRDSGTMKIFVIIAAVYLPASLATVSPYSLL